MFRILTLYLAKDSINKKRYDSVRLQKGVEQKIIVVSAKKIEIPNNLVVEVPEKVPSADTGRAVDKLCTPSLLESKKI